MNKELEEVFHDAFDFIPTRKDTKWSKDSFEDYKSIRIQQNDSEEEK